jgi:sugar O-acyltransferase (sialic acid O-acetyltransferase NeuD family)
MKRCLIVGAGGWGREVLSWALQVRQNEWEIAGFLNSDPASLDGKNIPYPILGDADSWTPSPDEIFLAGVGSPAERLKLCNGLKSRGAKFLTLVHPSVIQGLNVEIGEGCVISPNVVISANAKLDSFVLVNLAATLGHDCHIGDGTTVSCHVDVMGNVKVGVGCFLGSHACILPGKKVGDAAIVGAGSAVVRNVAAGTTVVGVPAQLLMAARKGKGPATAE